MHGSIFLRDILRRRMVTSGRVNTVQPLYHSKAAFDANESFHLFHLRATSSTHVDLSKIRMDLKGVLKSRQVAYLPRHHLQWHTYYLGEKFDYLHKRPLLTTSRGL